jgi:sugar phosphate isomerase/epimerase
MTEAWPAFDALPSTGFGFVIDTGHAQIAGGSNQIQEILGHVGGRMISLHLNDNDGRNDQHCPPGDGTVDWPGVAAGLAQAGYDGCILWETFSRLYQRNDDPAAVLSRCVSATRERFHDERTARAAV